jgi:hypothetical protein
MTITLPAPAADRRAADRFGPPVGCARVVVRTDGSFSPHPDVDTRLLDGHAYDVSVSGVRFELDSPLPAGMPVDVELSLPGLVEPVCASARIVRVFDEDDDPGPRRMAAVFTAFATPADARRLAVHLGSGYFAGVD